MSLVEIGRDSDGIARVTLNRPDKRNALSPELRRELFAALGAVLADEAAHAVVVTGAGGHFCSGGDIDSMAGLTAKAGRARMREAHRIVRLLYEADKPVVAAVEGFAVGAGAGLALLADTIVVANGATIGFPFFRVGLVPDFALLHTLPRRVGAARARDLLLYARMVKAPDAVAIGLADHLVPDGEAVARATALALELAAMPPGAFALAKRQLALAPQPLDHALEQEAMAQALAFTSEEHAEGRTAFREKRAPRFR
jgi:2-(1,2-epoxy-1,2-dihydrophenyl)acetyl-CoA isomerase